MNLKSHPARQVGRPAFTLVELMVSASILTISLALTFGVLLAVTRLNVRTTLKDELSADFRSVTRLLADQGRLANTFRIYKSFAESDRVSGVGQGRAGGPVGVAQSGDLVVFVYFSSADIGGALSAQRISRIIGVFREDSGGGVGPLRYFDSAIHNWKQTFSTASPAPAVSTIEQLLPPYSYLSQCPVLAQLTLGTVGTTTDLNTFYNLNNTALLVNGMIFKEKSNSGAGLYGFESKNAYNLTITPRS